MKAFIPKLFFIPNITENFLWKTGKELNGQDAKACSLFDTPYSIWTHFSHIWNHHQKWDYRFFKGLFALKNSGFHN